MRQIHQILPCLSSGDAIGNHTLEIQEILQRWGYTSYIFADDIHKEVRAFAKPYIHYKKYSSPDNILIYHFSVGSPVSELVRGLPDKKILIYHNITPSEFLKGFEDFTYDVLRRGRDELRAYRNVCNLALGDSEFNRLELEEMGFKSTGVLPIITDFEKYTIPPRNSIATKYQDGYVNLLFVGRVIPNKRQEDVILAFYFYKKYINPKSRLFLVGLNGIERYDFMLEELIKRLKLDDVYFTGKVQFDELLAYYTVAHVFLCMSEHEGFCVPLVESMYFKTPIIAYDAGSIPYTLDNSGIRVHSKKYEEIAEMIHLLVEDKDFRAKVIESQTRRLTFFHKARIEEILRVYLNQLIMSNE
jgi:glycosyltransferase involved in cell wall biosynthesis